MITDKIQERFARGRSFKVWEFGWEHIYTEGSSEWQKLRESHGLTREEVEELTVDDGGPTWEEQTMLEDRPWFPDMQHLVALSTLYGMSPGELLDYVLLTVGQPIADEHREES